MNFELPKAMPPQVNVDLNIKLANEQWRKDPAIGAFMSWFYYKVRNLAVLSQQPGPGL